MLATLVSLLVAGLPGAALAGTSGAALAGASGSWRAVTFDGVSLRTPAWPVVNLAQHPSACPRLDVHAVYLGTPGPAPACPPGLLGKTEAVQIQPASPRSPDVLQARTAVVIAGHPARTNADSGVTHTIIDILTSAGVEVSLSYGSDLALARQIASTIRIAGSAHAAPLAPLAGAAAAAVTPSAPQGIFRGAGFDTCAAPSASALNSWLASPYRAVGIYIGGINRACAQSSLTASWITAIRAHGWHYFPLYVGLQAACVQASGDAPIIAAKAAAEGTAAAIDAVTQAQSLGIPPGTPLIYDMEAYSGCGAEVITFLSAWDAELHAKGYQAGVYESFSNIGDLVHAAGTMTEPDVIHYADWDGHATTTSSYMPARMWTSNQRIHQYKGGHEETWGGVAMDIDNDQLDADLGGPPVTTSAPARPAFRIAVGMTSSGSAQWFAKTARGTLVDAYQDPAGTDGWSAVSTVGDSPSGIASNPAVAADANGSLTVFARDLAGQIVHAWQQGAPGSWQWGKPLAGAGAPAASIGDPAAIRRPGGDVEVFVTGSAGAVAATSQDKPNDDTGWTAWTSIGGSCASSPVPFVDTSSRLEVFCTTRQGTVAVDILHGGTWGGWALAGSSPSAVRGVPAVVSDGAGQTEVFAVTASGRVDYAWRDAAGTWAWGAALATAAPGRKITYSPAAVAWPGGKVAVFGRLASGQLRYTLQTGSGAAPGWASWTSIGGSALSSPAGWLSPGGVPQAAVLDRKLRLAVSSYSSDTWSSWAELGGGF